MGNSSSCWRSNQVRSSRSRTKDSQDEEQSKDKFPTVHEVRVPIDYPSKARRPLSISLRSKGSFRLLKSKDSKGDGYDGNVLINNKCLKANKYSEATVSTSYRDSVGFRRARVGAQSSALHLGKEAHA